MGRLILRLLINALALWLTVLILSPNVTVQPYNDPEPGASVIARFKASTAPVESPKRSILSRPNSNAANPARPSLGYSRSSLS